MVCWVHQVSREKFCGFVHHHLHIDSCRVSNPTKQLHMFQRKFHVPHINCDWIYGNRSKSHIGSYEIIDFKDFNTLKLAKHCEHVNETYPPFHSV